MSKVVDFYSKQIKYTGSYGGYSPADLVDMAKSTMYGMTDDFDYSEVLDDETAEHFDGLYVVENTYPCNKIATVKWSYIREEEEEV